MNQVGDAIKAFLHKDGRSQTWLARESGIPIHKLNLALNGKRKLNFDEYERICGALNVDTNRFLKPRKVSQ